MNIKFGIMMDDWNKELVFGMPNEVQTMVEIKAKILDILDFIGDTFDKLVTHGSLETVVDEYCLKCNDFNECHRNNKEIVTHRLDGDLEDGYFYIEIIRNIR